MSVSATPKQTRTGIRSPLGQLNGLLGESLLQLFDQADGARGIAARAGAPENSSPPQRPIMRRIGEHVCSSEREIAQQLIAGGVAVGIVDGFEAVHIDGDQRDRLIAGAGNFGFQLCVERAVVQ